VTPAAAASDAPPPPEARQQRVAVYGICRDGAGDGAGSGSGSGEGSGYEGNDRVLLVRAAPHLTVAGQWFLPGGGLDHGEHPVDGLRREFREETGLDIVPGPLLGIISDVFILPNGTSLHTLRIIHGVDGWSGTLRDEVGGSSDAARWVPVGQALALPLRPYVRQALTELLAP
jgi:8-oxo-dGTP diphosphatase